MTAISWNEYISAILSAQRAAAEADPEHLFKVTLPRAGAAHADIAECQRQIPVMLSEQIWEFLKMADGWSEIWNYTTIFGTSELSTRSTAELFNREDVSVVLGQRPHLRRKVWPIAAAAPEGVDVFLAISIEADYLPGGVVWCANGREVEALSSFEGFIQIMLENNRFNAEQVMLRRK